MEQEILSLAQACKRIPPISGKRPHISTLYRWYDRGINGVHLECLKIGRKLAVTQEALDRFFREAGAAGPQRRPRRMTPAPPPKGRTPKERERAIAEAEDFLRKNGAL